MRFVLNLAKRIGVFAFERSGVAEVVRQMEVVGQSPTFRMYYDLARNAGANHDSAMRYAKYWAGWRSS